MCSVISHYPGYWIRSDFSGSDADPVVSDSYSGDQKEFQDKIMSDLDNSYPG